MPRVHTVQKARKAIPSAGVAIGDTYYWWKFRYGGKRVSKTYPRASQLTQSEFLGAMYYLQERIGDLKPENFLDAPDDLKSELEEIASEIRQLGEEQEDKRNNMPEQLQDGDTGNLLQERADGCSQWADDLDCISTDLPDRDDFVADAETEYFEELEIEGEDGKPTRELTPDEQAELDERIDEKYHEELTSVLQGAIDEAQATDPGVS